MSGDKAFSPLSYASQCNFYQHYIGPVSVSEMTASAFCVHFMPLLFVLFY